MQPKAGFTEVLYFAVFRVKSFSLSYTQKYHIAIEEAHLALLCHASQWLPRGHAGHDFLRTVAPTLSSRGSNFRHPLLPSSLCLAGWSLCLVIMPHVEGKDGAVLGIVKEYRTI